MRLIWLLTFTLFSAHLAHGAQSSILHLAEGTPGCWQKIRPGALTASELKKLTGDCLNFRNDYLSLIELAQKSPKKYENKIIQTLRQAKQAKSPYEAIFFASLIHTDRLKDALKARAEVEQKLKVPFRYAEVALYRLSGRECIDDAQFAQTFYFELCTAEDSILPAYFGQGEN